MACLCESCSKSEICPKEEKLLKKTFEEIVVIAYCSVNLFKIHKEDITAEI